MVEWVVQKCRPRRDHAENPSLTVVPADPESAPKPRAAGSSVATPALRALGFGPQVPSLRVFSRLLPDCELPTSEPRARLRRKPSTCRAPFALMIQVDRERSPAESGPLGPRD